MESSQLYAATLTHYSTEPLTTGPDYLGVPLSNDLEWSKHIATMTNKANSKLSFLHCNLKGCPEKLKKTAFFFDSLFYGV